MYKQQERANSEATAQNHATNDVVTKSAVDTSRVVSYSKVIKTDAGHIRSSTRMSTRRFTRTNQGVVTKFESTNIRTVNVSGVISAGSGSSPGIDQLFSNFYGHAVSGVNFFNTMPTDSDLNKWISDCYSFVENADFGANEEQVGTPRNENSPSNSTENVVETCSENEFNTEPAGKEEHGAGQQVTTPWPENFNVAHSAILDDVHFLLGSEEESLVR